MTIAALRLTRPTVDVLRLLLAAPTDAPLWGAKIGERADLGKSSVSQILTRLTTLGWVTAREEEGPHPGRPARVFRVLTETGRRQAKTALAARRGRHEPPTGPADTQTAAAPDPGTAPVRSRGVGLGHWPIRFPDLAAPRRAVSAAEEDTADGRVREARTAYERLRSSGEALRDINRAITAEVLIRAAADPDHTLEYEPVLTAIAVEADVLRRKTLHAPRAKSG